MSGQKLVRFSGELQFPQKLSRQYFFLYSESRSGTSGGWIYGAQKSFHTKFMPEKCFLRIFEGY